MPCAEFTNAIAWNKKSTPQQDFPVVAYFTKHFGSGGVPASKDAVHYASGRVAAVDKPTPHLAGSLKAAKNIDSFGQMDSTSDLTYDVEIFPDGILTYLMKINNKPVGGMSATKVQATCVQDVLLTATTGSEVVTVGVALKPAVFNSPG
jgi:hypothetical protein